MFRVTGASCASMIAISLLLCGNLRTAEANEGVVEAWGEAHIKRGDTVAAKKAAIADGLKRCVEKVVGIQMTTEFTQQVQETVRNNQTDFQQSVSDKISQKAEGFVQTYDILDERVEGEVLKLHIRAHIFESKLKAEVKKLAELIAGAGNPKLMVVIQEVMTNTDDVTKTSKESLMAANIEQMLIARGFEVRGQRRSAKITRGSADRFDDWMDDIGSAAAMVRDEGADVLIFGRVEFRDKGVVENSPLKVLNGQRQLEIAMVVRGMNAASGEVFSAAPNQQKEYGSTIERAMHRSLKGSKGRGFNLVEKTFGVLLEDLKTSFQKTADRGHSYVVVLKGVSSFRKQGRPFIKALKGAPDVSEVKQKSFASGTLTVDLHCKCDANELQGKIFDASESHKALGNIDVAGTAGKEIVLKL